MNTTIFLKLFERMIEMYEELLDNLYRIEIPLPKSPLKYLNSYLIKSEDRNLIVDTGLNREECFTEMTAALKALDVDPAKTDFIITHHHADHFGLVARLIVEGSRVFMGAVEKHTIENFPGFEALARYAMKNGFPEGELRDAINNHPGFRFGIGKLPEITGIEDGETRSVGGYRFQCIHTPGHTPGHICLYEPDRKVLLAGDHILIDITPNIQCWSDEGDPLNRYIESLDKVYTLDVERVFPGHRRLFPTFRERIDGLKTHHEQRADEILEVLDGKTKTGYEVASMMTWDIACNRWNDFPVAQKWFATGEAIAHLRYLETAGNVVRRPNGDGFLYTLG